MNRFQISISTTTSMPGTIVTLFLGAVLVLTSGAAVGQARYTTRGQDIVDVETGKPTLLQGFGLGGWLLPEGYMWGIRTLDRPRQFEEAVADLIGEEDASRFWRLYHDNFVTEGDVRAMSAFGANSIRVALLASRLQPRGFQPDEPPYLYDEEGFRFLDSMVVWCNRYDVGVIWDMHGAPGAQNAENIADSDGEARLWTEQGKYWPLLTDLWYQIAKRYAGDRAIIGYDLLNEPLLRRYDGISTDLLRALYVQLTDTIRTADPYGLIFVEGDDWAQNFSMLEPLDWDDHLVLAFHSYPPTSSTKGLRRWDDLRRKYDVPLWHGETGEQRPPFTLNKKATAFLNSENVGWNWWTHKKLSRQTQPWHCPKTPGFQRILDYWMGKAERPTRENAREWLFDQAQKTHSDYCDFLPDMVTSLEPFTTQDYYASLDTVGPQIYAQPDDQHVDLGGVALFSVRAVGYPLRYEWTKDGQTLAGETGAMLRIAPQSMEEDSALYRVTVSNARGGSESRAALLRVGPFRGSDILYAESRPVVDGVIDEVWHAVEPLPIASVVAGVPTDTTDLSASFRALWDDHGLYVLVDVRDDVRVNTDPRNYHNDGVELYVDCDNSKSMEYDHDDFHMLQVRQRSELIVHRGKPNDGISQVAAEREDGYVVEFALPWSALRCADRTGPFVGLDVQVNDNDRDRRELKLAWFGVGDNAHVTPTAFGTLRIAERK